MDMTGPNMAFREYEGRLATLREEVAKLQKFKDYVHKRLDEAGVPADPDSPHRAEGCRIGGRLDIVLAKPRKIWATEQEAFTQMLNRSGAGYGLRNDHNPDGTAVQVESETADEAPMCAEFWFDAAGMLKTVHISEMELG